jgi:hypothetical protein
MREIYWVLLIGPPTLGILCWFMTRGWITMTMGNRTTPRIDWWRKYDLWIILGIMYVVMFGAAVLQHKL